MSNVIELQTRVALKYDSYTAWTTAPGKDLVLLKGEFGICEIPSGNTEATTAPTVLFKVGNGTSKFSELQWASAKAADVYGWAKSETVVLDGQIIKFKTGNTVVHSIDLSTFATAAEVNTFKESIESRVSAIEGSLGGSGDIGKAIDAVEERLDIIEGDANKTGSIANAVAEAIASAAADATSKATTAEANAKTYTNTEIAKDRKRLTDIEDANAEQDAAITANETAIATEKSDREGAIANLDAAYKAADKAINDKIGGSFDSTNTVSKAIEAAQSAANAVDSHITALLTDAGQIGKNKKDIEGIKSQVTELSSELEQETNARDAGDKALNDRLLPVEAFFKTVEGETIDQALDTLVEIQDYLNGDGSATGGLIDRIAANEDDIEDLKETLATGGDFEKRVAGAESNITALSGDVSVLKSVTSGYSEAGEIKSKIDEAKAQADMGVANAKIAQDGVNEASANITTLTNIVGDNSKGLVKKVNDNSANIATLQTGLDTANTNIGSIQAIVSTGDNSNDKLRTAITALEALTGDSNKGNTALRTDVNVIANLVNDENTGLSKAYAIATAAQAKAEQNAANYSQLAASAVHKGDLLILSCGSATEGFFL